MLSTLNSHRIWPKHSLSSFFSIKCPEFLSWEFSFLSAAQLSGLCTPHHTAMINCPFQQSNIYTEDKHSKSHNSMSHTGSSMLIKREFIKLDCGVSSTPNLLWMQPYSSKQTKWSLEIPNIPLLHANMHSTIYQKICKKGRVITSKLYQAIVLTFDKKAGKGKAPNLNSKIT